MSPVSPFGTVPDDAAVGLRAEAEGDLWYPGQARQLFDALTCDKTFLLFTADEGAEDHCQVGSPLLSAQRMFDWLDETLSRVPSASAA